MAATRVDRGDFEVLQAEGEMERVVT